MRRPFDCGARPYPAAFDLLFLVLGLSLVAARCLAEAPRPTESTAEHPEAGDAHHDIGRAQSPIDLPPEAIHASGAHRVALHYHDTSEHIIHREHTVEVKVDPGSSLDFDGRAYILEQFHFHTPSEHLVGASAFPPSCASSITARRAMSSSSASSSRRERSRHSSNRSCATRLPTSDASIGPGP